MGAANRGGEVRVGGVGAPGGVDGGDAVVPQAADGQAGVGVGGGGVAGVPDEGGPGLAAVLGNLDPVAGEGGPPVYGGRLPLQIDGISALGGGREPGRGAGGASRASRTSTLSPSLQARRWKLMMTSPILSKSS